MKVDEKMHIGWPAGVNAPTLVLRDALRGESKEGERVGSDCCWGYQEEKSIM